MAVQCGAAVLNRGGELEVHLLAAHLNLHRIVRSAGQQFHGRLGHTDGSRIHFFRQHHRLGINRDLLQARYRLRRAALLVSSSQVRGQKLLRLHEQRQIVHRP